MKRAHSMWFRYSIILITALEAAVKKGVAGGLIAVVLVVLIVAAATFTILQNTYLGHGRYSDKAGCR